MTTLWGDTGKMAFGPLKQTTILFPTPREVTGMGLTLPTTKPGTPQLSFTVQASDFADFSGLKPITNQNVPLVYACGKIGAAASIISYDIQVNGVSLASASSASSAANLYYTYTIGRYANLSIGDVVTVFLWSNQTDTTLVYSAFTTCPSRMQFTKGNTILKDVTYGTGTAFPTLSSAPTPTAVVTTQPFVVYPSNVNTGFNVSNPTITLFQSLVQDLTIGPYYTGRSNYGDTTNTVFLQTHATNQSFYVKNYMPSTISFREVLR
jgi:hypothetical protein